MTATIACVLLAIGVGVVLQIVERMTTPWGLIGEVAVMGLWAWFTDPANWSGIKWDSLTGLQQVVMSAVRWQIAIVIVTPRHLSGPPSRRVAACHQRQQYWSGSPDVRAVSSSSRPGNQSGRETSLSFWH